MSEYAVIIQNDESKWDDIKGELYNYPKPRHVASREVRDERTSGYGRTIRYKSGITRDRARL